jgi:hypothetical protein
MKKAEDMPMHQSGIEHKIPMHKESVRKTPPLERAGDGTYPGSIGGEYRLTAQETRKVRESLAGGPKYVSAIAKECDIPQTHPARFDALCKYIDHLGKNTLEAEMIWEEKRAGKKFVGWKLTEHGQKILEVS